MGTLWTSYKPPQTSREAEPLINTWLQFFGTIPANTVSRAIMEIAAEGGEFAPQVGQIYARIKTQREALPAKKRDEDFENNLRVYAIIMGATPPRPDEDGWEWFCKTRDAAREAEKNAV